MGHMGMVSHSCSKTAKVRGLSFSASLAFFPLWTSSQLPGSFVEPKTYEEKQLWRELRGRRFAGFKFRRQHVLGLYVLDFYCADATLAVELDGSQHGFPEGQHQDELREAFLAEQGIETLRFWNLHWQQKREGCLLEIWNAAQRRSGWVRVMNNAGAQTFIPPDPKQVKFPGQKPDHPGV